MIATRPALSLPPGCRRAPRPAAERHSDQGGGLWAAGGNHPLSQVGGSGMARHSLGWLWRLELGVLLLHLFLALPGIAAWVRQSTTEERD